MTEDVEVEHPILIVKHYTNTDPDFPEVIVGIFRAEIMEVGGSDELIPCCPLPVTKIQDLVDMLRKVAAEEGLEIR
jgi:hypothetical protein